jgi:hypothetical protein
MMGVFDDEIEEVSDNGKRPDLRIIGFDEEEQRLRHRSSGRPHISLKLPQGQYIFCDFRTLHLPGIEVSHTTPPPALKATRNRLQMFQSSFTVPCLNYALSSPQTVDLSRMHFCCWLMVWGATSVFFLC